MKKIILFLTCIFLAVGCSCANNKAADAVKDYLNDYKGLSDNVLKDIETLAEKENIDENNKDAYRETLKRQYRDLMYTIENEDYDGDSAKVTAKITVYDLYKAQKNSNDYLNEHKDEFTTNGAYDTAKYLEYKLKEMSKITDTISYTIVFKVNKEDGKWKVEQPNEETLEKIHGVYNYDEKDD